MSRLRDAGAFCAYTAANCLFVWMFLSSEAVQRISSSCGLRSPDGRDLSTQAISYAYDWRHGMTDGWPIFVPGFILLTLATALFARSRPLVKWAPAALLALVAAAAAAMIMAPWGTRLVLNDFQHHAGALAPECVLPPSWNAACVACLTAAAWSLLIAVTIRAVATRRLRGVVLPLLAYSILTQIRRGEFGSLLEPWLRSLAAGDPAAYLTILVAIAITWILVATYASSGTTPNTT